ncbi:MAG TPA: helix-turn-helix domain-containing protein [Patescibacteria group bacterium]|nr:helix-turn-helix domain-containing protein [Patescibacteria group bacterium]
MSDQPDNLTNILSPYGLSDVEAKIYLFLVQNGFNSALVISRSIHMGRTKVYRILDRLIAKKLVEQKVDDMGMKFGATDPAKFAQLVTEREHEVESLKESLPTVIENIERMSWRKHEKTKILYYKGQEGLEQITYNSTRANNEIRTYEIANDMNDFLPEKFAEEMRRMFVKNKIHIKELTWRKDFQSYTDVHELVTKYWELRYIDPESLDIKSETLIYNDVYAMYNPFGDEIFGIEIYNEDLVKMQKRLFDIIWNQAPQMKILTPEGKAALE